MVIMTMLVAMAAWNSTTTPRTLTASGSTEPGRRDYLGSRARAPDNNGVQNHNNNNNNSADNNTLQLLLGEGDRAGPGDQHGNCPRYDGESKEPPAERRKPRRELGATLPWRASNTTTHITQNKMFGNKAPLGTATELSKESITYHVEKYDFEVGELRELNIKKEGSGAFGSRSGHGRAYGRGC